MHIEHIAIWVRDLEVMGSFYEKYFKASSNEMYHNESKSFRSYFLSFDSGSRIELMNQPDLKEPVYSSTGYVHLAIHLGSKEAVINLTEQLLMTAT